jgi:hypothetical protein
VEKAMLRKDREVTRETMASLQRLHAMLRLNSNRLRSWDRRKEDGSGTDVRS